MRHISQEQYDRLVAYLEQQRDAVEAAKRALESAVTLKDKLAARAQLNAARDSLLAHNCP